MNKDTKSVLRKKFLNLLRSQKGEERIIKSKEIQKKLFSLKEFVEAKIILFYASFDGEVETFTMMKLAQKLGKRIALPRIIKAHKKILPVLIADPDKDLAQGPYGVQEPRASLQPMERLEDLDLVLVPGVVFDRNNNRLGRGVGYYDRFLASLPPGIPTFGLAFDFQIIDSLPQQNRHDVAVSRVIFN